MIIVFRHDSYEKWKELKTIPAKDEIIIIEYKNGNYKVCCGDGITPGYKLPRMRKFPAWITYKNYRMYGHFEKFERKPKFGAVNIS